MSTMAKVGTVMTKDALERHTGLLQSFEVQVTFDRCSMGLRRHERVEKSVNQGAEAGCVCRDPRDSVPTATVMFVDHSFSMQQRLQSIIGAVPRTVTRHVSERFFSS